MVAVENPVLLLSDEFRGQDGFGTLVAHIPGVFRWGLALRVVHHFLLSMNGLRCARLCGLPI